MSFEVDQQNCSSYTRTQAKEHASASNMDTGDVLGTIKEGLGMQHGGTNHSTSANLYYARGCKPLTDTKVSLCNAYFCHSGNDDSCVHCACT